MSQFIGGFCMLHWLWSETCHSNVHQYTLPHYITIPADSDDPYAFTILLGNEIRLYTRLGETSEHFALHTNINLHILAFSPWWF